MARAYVTMRFVSIRAQFLAWLIVLLLPIVATGLWTLHLFSETVEQRIGESLTDSLRLEAARLSESLTHYTEDAETLAMEPALSSLLAGQEKADTGQLIDKLLTHAALNRTSILELAILDRGGMTVTASPGFSWNPADDTLAIEAMATARTLFGDAFYDLAAQERKLGLATPILNATGDVAGAVLFETRLGPIVDQIVVHEEIADTSEVHIAQPTPHGDAEFITPLRFDRDAAFSQSVPAGSGMAINRALVSPRPQLLRMRDYRGERSILAVMTLHETGWGVVAKIDEAEAFAATGSLRKAASLALFATVLLVAVAWICLLNPLGIRLKNMATAAERIAEGHLDTFVGDSRQDELGDAARTIDRLASELEADRRQREFVEAQLRHQATHDELTGLHNRKHANAFIKQLSETPNRLVSIIFMDLDGFKTANDEHGHNTGDEILVELANRLSVTIGPNSCVARWGGDEFVVILPDADNATAAIVTRDIRALFDYPFVTSSGEHHIACSLGLATSSAERPLKDVLALADREMYAEKNHRRSANSIETFAARTLTSALHEHRVELWLQPIASIPAPGEVQLSGAEALVRIRGRDGGMINPSDFLGAVRRGPLGSDLDSFVLDRSIHSLSRWRRIGLVDNDFRLSINVTGASLHDPDLAQDIAALLDRHSVPADRIVIEISEKTDEIELSVLEQLRELGVKIALDDVGLHRNNLDRLVSLAPDIAKLDRLWMNDSVVLPRLVDLCHTLGLELVAEGVETEQQVALLQDLAVTRFQGYWFDKPRPAIQFIQRWGKFLDSHDTTVRDKATNSVLI